MVVSEGKTDAQSGHVGAIGQTSTRGGEVVRTDGDDVQARPRVRTRMVTLFKNRPHGHGHCPRGWPLVATDCPCRAEAVPGPNSLMN